MFYKQWERLGKGNGGVAGVWGVVGDGTIDSMTKVFRICQMEKTFRNPWEKVSQAPGLPAQPYSQIGQVQILKGLSL